MQLRLLFGNCIFSDKNAKGMGEKLILIEVKSAVQITRQKQTQGLR